MKTMNTKFVVRVNRGSTRATEYVQRVDLTPIQMTPNRKLALVMGRFTAEDAVKSLQNSRCSPELISVQVLSPEVCSTKITKRCPKSLRITGMLGCQLDSLDVLSLPAFRAFGHSLSPPSCLKLLSDST